jgi:GT2 family glycosyltransferase
MWNLGMKDGFLNHGMDYVFVVNNDILFHRETIDRLVEKFERADDDVVMITCNNIRSDCENMPKRIFTVNPAIYENVREDEHPDFSAFMVNRKFLEKVGEIDEGFSQIGGAWFEDNDTHRRIKLAGLRAIKLPSAIYYHYGSATSSQIGQLKHLKFESNRDYFVGKWGGMPDVDGLYQHSFNDEVKNYRWTLQSESMDKQLELVKRFRKF